ncbi:MAG: DUF6492 family protein [Isosphaeraceae bacterium]|nr:DUF6492 family protein [Isosphaeraceae bacterium]
MYAIITPSYEPDFEQCRLASESIDRYVVGNYHHYILVEHRDLPLFAPLKSRNRSVLVINDHLPKWLFRIPLFRGGWMSLRTPPVRNWIIQQVVKISAVDMVPEEVMIFVDSDFAFIRPVDLSMFDRGGKTWLYRVAGAANQMPHRLWHRAAAKLLGLPPTDYFGATYIGHPTIWRRDVVENMRARVEEVTGRSWQAAVCSEWQFSEYILYGVFAEVILGESANHFFSPRPLSHNSWDYPMTNEAEIRRFFEAVRAEHLAVMVSSKQYIPVCKYRAAYDAIRDRVDLPLRAAATSV